jgi:Na+-transporting methylmalonyl-CoA/oxaloacetate decarboxylase gamma subunit
MYVRVFAFVFVFLFVCVCVCVCMFQDSTIQLQESISTPLTQHQKSIRRASLEHL